MNYNEISIGLNPPKEVNVLIEIAPESGPVKYEYDSLVGGLIVDRIMQTSMSYPCNYGFIPHTLSEDGDPVDALVYSHSPLIPGCLIAVRPIGVLVTEDEKGRDEKILTVPAVKIDPLFAAIKNYDELPLIFIERIEHFFCHYKDLEKNKWVKVAGWRDFQHAEAIISAGIERVKNK